MAWQLVSPFNFVEAFSMMEELALILVLVTLVAIPDFEPKEMHH